MCHMTSLTFIMTSLTPLDYVSHDVTDIYYDVTNIHYDVTRGQGAFPLAAPEPVRVLRRSTPELLAGG